MAEVILSSLGEGRFEAYSAGSYPAGEVNPAALTKLRDAGHETNGLRSKSWHEFEGPDAPVFNTVITVCDNAARESCPVWIGRPVSMHWGIPDPAAIEGNDDEIRQAFDNAYNELKERIAVFLDVTMND
jgi:arsenate reductase